MTTPTPASVRPEDCPEPGWHQTHRYCPCCSWREPEPVSCGQALTLVDGPHPLVDLVCNLPYKHAERNGTAHSDGTGYAWSTKEAPRDRT